MQRTKNTIRNIMFGLLNKIILLFGPFIIRMVIIKQLGSAYLGLSGLFTSILQVLNLTELGFSSAVVFSMYKPIAENDSETICALMNLYKKIYRIIGIIILVVGLMITPFITNIIKGSYPSDINIYILYIIYLFNTAITYFLFAYKSALLTAHQRNDIISNVNTILHIIEYIVEIIILCVVKNYYLYVLVTTAKNILNNIICAYKANKLYPQYIAKGTISKDIVKDIKKRVSGLMIQKICTTTRNSLDSIFISAFIGLNVVAIYSNYYLIMNAIIGLIGTITTAMAAGIGNSIVIETVDKNYNDMNKFNFMYMWISGWCTICLACLYQPFMKLWMGTEYMFEYGVVILFCLYFYALKMGDIRAVYSDSKGLWWENRYRAIIETFANLILNLVLVKFLGIYGIIAGTLISLLIINFGYGSQILFKYYFGENRIKEYFKNHLMYFTVTLVIAIITYFICSLINFDGIIEIIIKSIICVVIPNILYFLIYFKTKKFEDTKIFVKNIISKFKLKTGKL